MEKMFQILNVGRRNQYIRAYGMGMIMFRSEADQIVGRFESRIQRASGDTSVSIVPPIASERLPELGAALVELARNLDPSGPPPDFEVL